MNILITGSTGFIGRNIVNYIQHKYPYINLILPNRHEILNISINNIEAIIHLAGNTSTKNNMTYHESIQIYQDNIDLTYKILSICDNKIRFIFASSASVYPNSNDIITETHKTNPQSLYAGTKLACENLCTTFHNMDKINLVILRYCTNVGKYAHCGLIPNILNILYNNYSTIKLSEYDPGGRKPYMYAEDTARITTEFIFNSINGLFNISTSDNINTKEIVLLLQSITKIYKPVEWLEEDIKWKDKQRLVTLSNTKLLNIYPNILKYNTSYKAIEKVAKDWIV